MEQELLSEEALISTVGDRRFQHDTSELCSVFAMDTHHMLLKNYKIDSHTITLRQHLPPGGEVLNPSKVGREGRRHVS
jgi:hypothetical protein